MPFTTTPDLDNDPSVKIFFIGLNILAPITQGGMNACQVFVHNKSPEHRLSIEVRRKHPGRPDQLMMRHLGPLTFTAADGSHTHGLIIQTDGLTSGKGVKAYEGPPAEGFRLFDSFSLADLLGSVPEVDRRGGLPSILIDHGVFYTADKVTVKARFVKNSGEEIPLTEVPTVIGANIKLDPDSSQQVTMFWRQEGQEVHLDLKPSRDFTYEIYIINEPLFEPNTPAAPRHGEFAEYFKILPGIQRPDQFEIEFLEEVPERGSTRTPCMSVLLSQ